MDAYHLEADIYTPTQDPNEKEQRETVKMSLGTTCKYNLECLHYNARVTVRVRASNRAGEGPFSKDITIYTEKGKVRKERIYLYVLRLILVKPLVCTLMSEVENSYCVNSRSSAQDSNTDWSQFILIVPLFI